MKTKLAFQMPHNNCISRQGQMDEFSDSIPAEGPVMIVGDFNLNRMSPYDQRVLFAFVERHNLKVVARYNLQKGYDMIMVRDIDVNWTDTIGHETLSDHAGLVVNFELRKDGMYLASAAPRYN